MESHKFIRQIAIKKIEQHKKIRILVSSYINEPYESRINSLHCLLYSLLYQTYQNFEIVVHHDGPLNDKSIKEKIELIDDRISFIETNKRKNNWGFDVRYDLAIADPEADYVLFTNDDNYYVPIFLQHFINILTIKNSELAYCNLIHNERSYGVIDAFPEIGYVDLGCFITSLRLIKETPWDSFDKEADGIYFKELASKTNAIKINNVLFVHN
jgi:hypothetical protein